MDIPKTRQHLYTSCLFKVMYKQTTCTCTLLPSNQSFYRQITSREKGGGVSGQASGEGRQQSTK